MFSGNVVWRGIIFTILMIFGKLVCGLWLVRLPVSMPLKGGSFDFKGYFDILAPRYSSRQEKAESPVEEFSASKNIELERVAKQDQIRGESRGQHRKEASTYREQSNDEIQPGPKDTTQSPSNNTNSPSTPTPQILTRGPTKPLSLYPPSILGLAMVARGEIGFLISSLAESNSIFTSAGSGTDEIFLIVTWAIMLCTVVGPVGVGLLVRRLKRLEKEKGKSGGGTDVLGVWGVN
jgi:hypothetical protein